MQDTPQGITPPAPGLEREEPGWWIEDDIPSDDEYPASRPGAASPGRTSHKPERE